MKILIAQFPGATAPFHVTLENAAGERMTIERLPTRELAEEARSTWVRFFRRDNITFVVEEV